MKLFDKMKRQNPVWRRIVERAFGPVNKGFVMMQAVAGAAAGNIALSKIKKGDHLVAALSVSATNGAITDLTAQFRITADAQVNNTGGTATTGSNVIFLWEAFDDE